MPSAPSEILFLLGATFAVALLESLAIVGLLLPGVALLFMLAATAAQYQVDFLWLVFAGFLGGFLGDSLSFRFGQSALSHPRTLRLLEKHASIQQKASQLCTRYGVAGLLIGRFIGPLRPFVPMTAGILEFPKALFYPTALVGSLAWAPVYLGPGYFLAYQPNFSLPPFILLSCIVITPFLLQGLFINTKRFRLLCFVSFIAIGCWLLGEKSIFMSFTPLTDLNLWIYEILSSKTLLPEMLQTMARQLAAMISLTGNIEVILFLSLCLGITWARSKHYSRLAWLAIALIIPFAFKLIFNLDRPGIGHLEATQSYPSGHTYFSFLFAMLLQVKKPKNQVVIEQSFLKASHYYWGLVLFIWAGSVALSRLVLQVHWLTDLMGAWLLAASVYAMLPPKTLTSR